MSHWIARWDPEDVAFWEDRGKRVARRNLIWSILAENVGFSVWLLWSVVAARLPSAGFHYTTDQLFLLVAIPGLVGAIMRFPYTFAVPRFGGRNWTVVSALLLLVPTLALGFFVQRPDTPFTVMACAAATAGLGGGNFASSMANISFFFPDREKGFALGLNAAGGNIGVSNVQLLVPLVVGAGGVALARAGWMWLPVIVLAAAGAFFFMDNLATAKSSFQNQIAVAKRRHTWLIAWLYIGTFGSFVGYSAAFPLLLKTQFPEVTTNLAFLGALVGSVARPLGGKIADRLGGARVTVWNFLAMAVATVFVLYALQAHAFGAFLTAFLVLFVTTGIGNGSTFRMIPAIFRAEALAAARTDEERALAADRGRRDTAAVLGITSAVGAIGGYLIPQAFSASIKATGSAHGALAGFIFFYATCLAITWWCYLRTGVTKTTSAEPALGPVNV
ncbi:MAG TPA: MFS transporter [Polyangiaceae bacterium]|jgi:NNP family nitrate/nitrite transporter-like MFS transporter